MTMNNNQSGGTAPREEELVAYLDGEMDAASRERLESQLATDAKLRGRLQALERTWEMLDELDAAPVGEPFTHSTLEMVALAAGEDADRENINMRPGASGGWRFMAYRSCWRRSAAGRFRATVDMWLGTPIQRGPIASAELQCMSGSTGIGYARLARVFSGVFARMEGCLPRRTKNTVIGLRAESHAESSIETAAPISAGIAPGKEKGKRACA